MITQKELQETLRKLKEAEATLEAIRGGKVDALVVFGEDGEEIRSIQTMGVLADSIFDQVSQAIFVVDEGCRILRANPKGRELCGNTPEWKPFLESLPLRPVPQSPGPDAQRELKEKLPPDWVDRNVSLGGVDVALTRPDGTASYFLLDARPFSFSSEAFRGGVITLQDITDHKVAEIRLAVRNEQLRYQFQLTKSITDNVAEALVLADGLGQIIFHNPASVHLFGIPEAQLAGKCWNDCFKLETEDRDGPPLDFVSLNALDRPLQDARATLVRVDGKRIPVLCSVTPVAAGNEKTGTVLVVRDMSQLKRTEEALRQSEEKQRHSQKIEAIGRLAGGVAHDFNNLLLAIMGFTELALGQTSEGETIHGQLWEIKRAGERAASLTRQLLAYGRKQMMAARIVDANALLSDMQKLMARVLGENISLRVECADEDLPVCVDPAQIQQVILNMALNSKDAMPAGGLLHIRSFRLDPAEQDSSGVVPGLSREGEEPLQPGSYAVLEVKDNGSGMDEEVKARLFEPFFTTKKFGKGSGLGLSTAYGIVKQSQGYLRVYSEPGQGAVFRVLLPLVKRADSPSEAGMHPENYPGGKETLLLVEDDESVLALLKNLLRQAGYNVLAASSGEEALRLAGRAEGRIHLLVADIVLPGMDGRRLAEMLKPQRPDLEVLFISGYTDDEIIRKGMAGNGRHFLAKPFQPKDLLTKLRGLLDKRAAS